MAKMRLMTQNQWNYTDNNEAWEALGLDCSAAVRMHGHVQVLKDVMPDIVGGQEVNINMQQLLKFYCMEAGLPYTLIWGNMTPLIYSADKLELLDTEYILYPVTVEGYEGRFNDARSKSLNLGVFREKASGKVFLFATTHLWYKKEPQQPGSDEVRRLQIKQAIDLIETYQEKYNGCPVILVGDMNAYYDSPAIQYAIKERGYSHAHDIATDFRHEGSGRCPCSPKKGPAALWNDTPFGAALDHILVKDIPQGAVSRFDRYCPDYYLALSDHAPAYIDIEL